MEGWTALGVGEARLARPSRLLTCDMWRPGRRHLWLFCRGAVLSAPSFVEQPDNAGWRHNTEFDTPYSQQAVILISPERQIFCRARSILFSFLPYTGSPSFSQ